MIVTLRTIDAAGTEVTRQIEIEPCNDGTGDWRVVKRSKPRVTYDNRKIVMTCDRCGYAALRNRSGACPRCKIGFMGHDDAGKMGVRCEQVSC